MKGMKAAVAVLMTFSVILAFSAFMLMPAPSPRLPEIGFLSTGPQTYHAAFWEGLAAAGYVDGQNIKVLRKVGTGSPQDLPALVDDLAASKVKAIVATNSASVQAALSRTSSIPIIMVTSATPIESNFIASYAHPGGNVTGVMMPHPETMAKTVQLMREAVPAIRTLAVLFNSTNPVHPAFLKKIRSEAEPAGVEMRTIDANGRGDWDATFEGMRQAGIQGLIVLVDPLINRVRERIVQSANIYKIPAIYPFKEFAQDGGLISYGVEFWDLHYRSAIFVDHILKGRKASELPVDPASRFELAINTRTAEALELTLPPTLLLRADALIDR